eukprot:TRINITY_DN7396_c0_g1_i1.p1 TRINITY_DN7396_c0_g1~~TRINITY_DN7396_c0_g1_i1.p1  ORF type:complete len:228 (+),score=37.19 TRINITY_DN7396_c0_g1_i1:1140-1823(+)
MGGSIADAGNGNFIVPNNAGSGFSVLACYSAGSQSNVAIWTSDPLEVGVSGTTHIIPQVDVNSSTIFVATPQSVVAIDLGSGKTLWSQIFAESTAVNSVVIPGVGLVVVGVRFQVVYGQLFDKQGRSVWSTAFRGINLQNNAVQSMSVIIDGKSRIVATFSTPGTKYFLLVDIATGALLSSMQFSNTFASKNAEQLVLPFGTGSQGCLAFSRSAGNRGELYAVCGQN